MQGSGSVDGRGGAPPTLAPSIEAACRRWPDRPAVTHAGRTVTYRRFHDLVLALAGAYQCVGIQPGDRVVCLLPNSLEHLVALNAAWAVGAIHVGADHDLTPPEVAWLAGWTEAAAVIVRAGDGDAAASAVRLEHPRTRVVVDGGGGDGTWSLAELTAEGARRVAVADLAVHPDDPGLILLTSGTTGRPKGVLETLPNCWAKMQFFADEYAPGPGDVHLVYLPVAHVFGMRLAQIALLSGGRLVLHERFSPRAAVEAVGAEGVTVLPGMPTHFRLLLGVLDPAVHDTASLRWGISAAATLPAPLAEQIYGRLGVRLLYIYGCSEGFTTETSDPAAILAGSAGRKVFRGPPGTPPDGTVFAVDPETSRRLPPGEVGEIGFGAAFPVRYWRAPPAAADGLYRTGDLGRVDPDGCVYLLGRLKELVNRGGLHVSPAEVEAALARHPGVADAGVIAAPDPVLGEAVCACVVPAGPEAPDLAGVRAFLAPTLARHKLPDELCVVAEIPRTSIGKVDRARLASIAAGLPRQRLRPPAGAAPGGQE